MVFPLWLFFVDAMTWFSIAICGPINILRCQPRALSIPWAKASNCPSPDFLYLEIQQSSAACSWWMLWCGTPMVCVCSVVSFCNPVYCSLPEFSIHGISQARLQEWVAISSSGDLPNSGIKSVFPSLAGRFFTTWPPGKPQWHPPFPVPLW